MGYQLKNEARVKTVAEVDNARDARARVVDENILLVCVILHSRHCHIERPREGERACIEREKEGEGEGEGEGERGRGKKNRRQEKREGGRGGRREGR